MQVRSCYTRLSCCLISAPLTSFSRTCWVQCWSSIGYGRQYSPLQLLYIAGAQQVYCTILIAKRRACAPLAQGRCMRPILALANMLLQRRFDRAACLRVPLTSAQRGMDRASRQQLHPRRVSIRLLIQTKTTLPLAAAHTVMIDQSVVHFHQGGLHFLE